MSESVTIKQLAPARAKHVSDKKLASLWDDPYWTLEQKLNGWRELMHLGRDLPRVHLTGRRESSVTGLMSEKGLCVPCLWPDFPGHYTVLDGEVLPPAGATFHDMASILNSGVDEALATQERIGHPSYHVFDVLFHDGEDVRDRSYLERRSILEELVPSLDHPLIRLVQRLPSSRVHYDEIVGAGGEGVILKNTLEEYGASGAWVKVKKVVTLDVIVTGFTDARFGKTGKFDGQIGAVVVSVYGSDGDLVEVGQVSGMSDEVRLAMTADKGSWLGQVIEVIAQEWGQNRLLHPRYGRRREDAEPRLATFTKLMRDLGREEPRQVDRGPQLKLL